MIYGYAAVQHPPLLPSEAHVAQKTMGSMVVSGKASHLFALIGVMGAAPLERLTWERSGFGLVKADVQVVSLQLVLAIQIFSRCWNHQHSASFLPTFVSFSFYIFRPEQWSH